MIGAAIDDAYIAELKKLVVHQDAIDQVKDILKIVYTPLHGTGNIPVRRVLKELGFQNVYVVPEQEKTGWRIPNRKLPESGGRRSVCIRTCHGKEVRCGHRARDRPGCTPSWCICKGF